MRAREFIREDTGATVSGSIATVSQPLGSIVSRLGMPRPTKYANGIRPKKPRKNQHVSG
jgi:hypothetical protein